MACTKEETPQDNPSFSYDAENEICTKFTGVAVTYKNPVTSAEVHSENIFKPEGVDKDDCCDESGDGADLSLLAACVKVDEPISSIPTTVWNA